MYKICRFKALAGILIYTCQTNKAKHQTVKVLNSQSEALDDQSEILDSRSEALDNQSAPLDGRSEVLDGQSEALDDQSKALDGLVFFYIVDDCSDNKLQLFTFQLLFLLCSSLFNLA